MATPTLAELDFLPYLDAEGRLPADLAKQVGIYAIFDAAQTLQFVGYSRDITLSLKQHLVRCPDQCHWLKVTTIDRPNRHLLETIQAAWIEANGSTPPGNADLLSLWTEPIDVKTQMTSAEQATYAAAIDELEQIKCLKKVAQRLEADLLLPQLQARGVTEPMRFDPKLKEQGLLNIKP